MGIRCAALCTERVVSPLLVLTIHGLIVADVAYYRQELWHEVSLWYRSLRLLAVATVAVYLRTCLTNPGFVSSAHATEALCSSKGCLLLCCAAFVSMSEWKDWKSKRVVELLASTAAPSPEAETSLDPETGKLEIAEGMKRRMPAEPESEASGLTPRWCKRCQLHQPLRTKHCHDCGRCVRTHDHHCPWIGSCVGENNRVLFFWFLILQCLELGLFFMEGIQGISLLEPSVVLLTGLLFIAMFFLMVSCLLFFHGFLMLANLTTWEHISWRQITYLRPLKVERGSPFARSVLWNVAAYCCGPIWCPAIFRRVAGLRYSEGGVLWEMSEQRGMCCAIACCADCC